MTHCSTAQSQNGKERVGALGFSEFFFLGARLLGGIFFSFPPTFALAPAGTLLLGDAGSFVVDGDDGDDRVLATAAAAALVIDEKSPPARRNTLGDSVPFWQVSEKIPMGGSCPDRSASIARLIVAYGPVSKTTFSLFGHHGGCDGVLQRRRWIKFFLWYEEKVRSVILVPT